MRILNRVVERGAGKQTGCKGGSQALAEGWADEGTRALRWR